MRSVPSLLPVASALLNGLNCTAWTSLRCPLSVVTNGTSLAAGTPPALQLCAFTRHRRMLKSSDEAAASVPSGEKEPNNAFDALPAAAGCG